MVTTTGAEFGLALAAAPLVTDDTGLEDFTIFGYKAGMQGKAAELHQMVTDAELLRTIDGAPTLTITVEDPDRMMVREQLLSYRSMFTLDRVAFELTQVKKTGDQFQLVFEDVRVAEMRRATTPRKVGPNTMSRVEFAYLLISELPRTDFVTPPISLSVTHNELARGKEATGSSVAQVEDTWKCLTRIFGDVQWRFWTDGGKVFAAPDDYLVKLPSAGTVVEYQAGVDQIDYDLDAGKRVQVATIQVIAERWSLPIGARIDIGGVGPQVGSWIVTEVRRSLFSKRATVKASLPVFPLPEPVQDDSSAGGNRIAQSAEALVNAAILGGALSGVGAGVIGVGTAPTGTFQAYAARVMQERYGWGPAEFAALDQIFTPESHWNPHAQNPTSTAYGIAQFLDGTWAGTGIAKTSDGYRQIDAGLIYIKNRYGTPSAALAFRRVKGWY